MEHLYTRPPRLFLPLSCGAGAAGEAVPLPDSYTKGSFAGRGVALQTFRRYVPPLGMQMGASSRQPGAGEQTPHATRSGPNKTKQKCKKTQKKNNEIVAARARAAQGCSPPLQRYVDIAAPLLTCTVPQQSTVSTQPKPNPDTIVPVTFPADLRQLAQSSDSQSHSGTRCSARQKGSGGRTPFSLS